MVYGQLRKKHSVYWGGKLNPTNLLFVRTGTSKGRLGSIFFLFQLRLWLGDDINSTRAFEKDVKDKYCLEKKPSKIFFSLNLIEDISSHWMEYKKRVGRM